MTSYLASHPDVSFSNPKEPHFFCDDLHGHWPANSMDEYLRCFAADASLKKAIGEGSVFYLYSANAVSNILKHDAHARFIVMLRNPVDAAYAFHSQMIYSFSESMFEFENAWRAQSKRKQGLCLPDFTLFDGAQQYGEIFSYSHQLSRLFDQAPRDNVRVIIFEEFAKDPDKAYAGTVDFLGLPQRPLRAYPVVNGSKSPHSKAAERAVQKAAAMKRELGISRGLGILRLARRINYQSKARSPLKPDFRRELEEFFREDVARASNLLNRDLSHWVSN